jgi:cell wall-associated NlpC family hydrolase
VQERLDAVEELLASMSEEQLAAVRRLEEDSVDAAQSGIGASGALSDHRPPSRKGEAALRYALAQVGKPYRWGAQGPHAFDCSGLTSRAWERAGRSIPRTSQGQWQGLPRVSLQQLRPGDLVVYFPGATHVALYAGGGKVVQAPRAGAAVNVSPIASNPLLGAVRPDG